MDGWYGFRAQGIHNDGETEHKSWYYPLEERWGCTVLYSRGGISGTAGISGMRAAPPGLEPSASAVGAVPARPVSPLRSATVVR